MRAALVIILIITAGCSRGASAPETAIVESAEPSPTEATVEEPSQPGASTDSRPPEEEQRITSLMERLNSWCESYPEECAVYANPDAYPGRASSGETGGWIVDVTEQLTELGVEVDFNEGTNRFER